MFYYIQLVHKVGNLTNSILSQDFNPVDGQKNKASHNKTL